jgi:hypothetical protein
LGIVGKLRDMLQGQSCGAFTCSVNDQGRNFDNLTLTASSRAGVALRL